MFLKIFKTQVVSPEEGRRLLPQCTFEYFYENGKSSSKCCSFYPASFLAKEVRSTEFLQKASQLRLVNR
jgi:hypothetical protein